MATSKPSDSFRDWNERAALAERMIPLIGRLYRKRNVACYMYGRSMVNCSVIELMKSHRFVRQIELKALTEFETFPLIEALAEQEPGPAHIDVGKLCTLFRNSGGNLSAREFITEQLSQGSAGPDKPLEEPRDVVLYGFGRIGRLVARLLIEKAGGGDVLRLRAIVVRKSSGTDDLKKRASLLRRDSVHGSFQGTITVDEEHNFIVCNGNPIQVIYASSPTEIDYTEFGIRNAIVVDNTGVWRDEEGLGQHVARPGIAKALLTAPGKGQIPNVVYGVNHSDFDDSTEIVSAASCTTNAIVPVLKAMGDEFGIERGHVESVHSYTNDQNLIDNYHKKSRRGRSAPLNMVLTETGAAKAVAKALPGLAGKLTGNAIRVPTPNVSMAILNLQLERETTREELNEFMRQVALSSTLQQQIGYTISEEAVSSDFVGSRQACVFDSQSTIVSCNSCTLYCWYDNEFGYSCQVVRVLEKMAGVKWALYPIPASV